MAPTVRAEKISASERSKTSEAYCRRRSGGFQLEHRAEGGDVEHQGAVFDQHALGLAGRARGVEHVGQRIAAGPFGQRVIGGGLDAFPVAVQADLGAALGVGERSMSSERVSTIWAPASPRMKARRLRGWPLSSTVTRRRP